jgi:hypothetical protein
MKAKHATPVSVAQRVRIEGQAVDLSPTDASGPWDRRLHGKGSSAASPPDCD